MVRNFSAEFRSFLESQKIDFSENGSLIYISKPAITIRLAILDESSVFQSERANITLYEDEWYTKFSLISNRLLANLGRQNSVFARNCMVRSVSTEEAKFFLNRNHILGFTKGRYKYGLFTMKRVEDIAEGALVAVAMFSAPRPMERGSKVVQSYEWVRYASIGNYRVVGGMGKLMSYFIEQQTPQEIMTYADKDWSDGDVYKKLGFVYQSETEPIEFYVNRLSLERISIKKLRNDRKYDTLEPDANDFIHLRNQGNLKFLWSSPLNK